jgi:ATP-dependent DNA helicase RecG
MKADKLYITTGFTYALSHRDYYEKGAVTTIELFDDRVEISNPGELLAAVGKDFGHKSISRNPLIFGLFQRMHLVEKVGSGILRMEELMLGNNLPAPIYQKEGMFSVIFKRPVAAVVQETMEKTMVKTSEKILGLINENNSITISELAKMIGLTTRAIEKQIDKLQKKNKIKRTGSDKSGYWQILP